MQIGDVVYYLRPDPKKYYRIPQILDLSKVMKVSNIQKKLKNNGLKYNN